MKLIKKFLQKVIYFNYSTDYSLHFPQIQYENYLSITVFYPYGYQILIHNCRGDHTMKIFWVVYCFDRRFSDATKLYYDSLKDPRIVL